MLPDIHRGREAFAVECPAQPAAAETQMGQIKDDGLKLITQCFQGHRLFQDAGTDIPACAFDDTIGAELRLIFQLRLVEKMKIHLLVEGIVQRVYE